MKPRTKGETVDVPFGLCSRAIGKIVSGPHGPNPLLDREYREYCGTRVGFGQWYIVRCGAMKLQISARAIRSTKPARKKKR